MKLFIQTRIVGEGTEEDPRRLYVANQIVPVSMLEIDATTCICRAAGAPAQIEAIKKNNAITVLTDDEARAIIKSKYPDSDLENLDIADPEIDEIARREGIEPEIRADIQIPTRGMQVLQDQENYLMAHICKRMGLTKKWWNEEARRGRWSWGKELENDIKDGYREAHEFVLLRIRQKIT